MSLAVAPVVEALLIASLVAYGDVWYLPIAWGVYMFTEFYFGLISISFVLAADWLCLVESFKACPTCWG